jgi:metal-dependent amidase/aminoacylase/carboxypeptidase family protein
MGSEDMGEYEHAGVPCVYLMVGVVPATVYVAWKHGGKPPPPAHSPDFAPDPAALRAAIVIETTAARALLSR